MGSNYLQKERSVCMIVVETLVAAISPEKTHLVVQRGERFAVIERKFGITKDTQWRDRNLLSSKLMKAAYSRFKTHVSYKGPGFDTEWE